MAVARTVRRNRRSVLTVALITVAALTLGAIDDETPFGAEPAHADHTRDLLADALEVTQGVQTLLLASPVGPYADTGLSVPLVAGKRTFVRFWARADDGYGMEPALLSLAKPSGESALLLPIGGPERLIYERPSIAVTPALRQSGSADSPSPLAATIVGPYLFELPEEFTRGTVTIRARVGDLCFVDCPPAEHDEANNVMETTVPFQQVPRPRINVYTVDYRIGAVRHETEFEEYFRFLEWLNNAFPIPFTANVGWAELDWGQGTINSSGDLTNPSCGSLNVILAVIRFSEMFLEAEGENERYYGMVNDGGGFMRGCAPVPGNVASGPTGAPGVNANPANASAWDSDGSYGDWYAGHELAHAYGRDHANFCSATDGVAYPYPSGAIGNVGSIWDGSGVYGFDVSRRVVYPPSTWRDLMTYCERQWLSDFTYEGLISGISSSSAAVSASAGEPGTHMFVSGRILPGSDAATVRPAFSKFLIAPPVFEPGAYQIVLRGAGGVELARHPFRPVRVHPGPPRYPGQADHFERLLIMHPVPLADGTERVDVVAPDGTLLDSLQPGTAPPTVEITSPAGGEAFRGPVEVAWEASDPDGDDLTFLVQYRPDSSPEIGAEALWRTVALPTAQESVEVPFGNLSVGPSPEFRVLATDGLHTTAATTEQSFEVVNEPPDVRIVVPSDGDVFVGEHAEPGGPVVSGAVALEGIATDADFSDPETVDEQLAWTSSIDGLLGQGAQLTVDSLSEGDHTITFEADDLNGGVSSAQIRIQVVGSPDRLPAPPDGLAADPNALTLAPWNRLDRVRLVVVDRDLDGVAWAADADVRWLNLRPAGGTTPSRLEVSLVRSRLPRRGNSAKGTVALTSPAFPGSSFEIPVEVGLARCDGTAVNRLGTSGPDRMGGTGGPDGFLLLSGNDRGKGRGGSDAMCGNLGNDRLRGGDGNDDLFGGVGRDVLVGGAGGGDVCVGGPGRDVLRGCERGD